MGGGQGAGEGTWTWQNIKDFDRMEKFSADEVLDDGVVFKLVDGSHGVEESMDERPQHISGGYDCFALYKHQDNSLEWRSCKIVQRMPGRIGSAAPKTFIHRAVGRCASEQRRQEDMRVDLAAAAAARDREATSVHDSD